MMDRILINIITFLTIFRIGLSINVDPIDLSSDCKNKLKSNYFLTNGLGTADGIKIIFANKGLNCTINLYTKSKAETIYQILVLEDFNSCNNLTIVLDGTTKINACKYLEDGKPFLVDAFNHSKTSVTIEHKSIGRLQLLAASSNALLVGNKCKTHETLCTIRNVNLCLNSELRCEFYKYCGHTSLETARYCGIKTNLSITKEMIFAIIAGIFFLLVSLFIIYRLIYRCMPRLPKRFFKSIHHEDIKLIVATQPSPVSKRKIGLKQITTNMTSHKKKIEDIIDDTESEMTSFIYSPPQRSHHKKRQTTNTPVLRGSRVATILLESISDLQNNAESTPRSSTESDSVFDEDNFVRFPKTKRYTK